jgi:hypothetical protein
MTMGQKEYGLTLVLAAMAGLVGGGLSGRFLVGDPVIAEETPRHVKVFEAEQFRLVDKEGNIKGALMTLPDGSTGFALMDKGSLASAGFALNTDGSVEMGITGKDGKSGIKLKAHTSTASDLTFYDANGKNRATLALGTDGKSALWMFDKDFKQLVTLAVGNNDEPLFGLTNLENSGILVAQGTVVLVKSNKKVWMAP